ncbi:cell wall hydrolase [Qipengyuania psychrotolerans]|uniref:cell wall hydrolase n=1 Tax=Qipengyuania psychrotolerans TaxID=2867238 RepID=UPI001FFD5E63|nr:cell wall hydrolase [Qipengyuania psychrotolerans]
MREARAAARRQFAKRAAVLATAVALPTAAAQGVWPGFASAMGLAENNEYVEPMPFEIAGQSFPGSAFYYLDQPPRPVFDIEELRASEGDLETAKFTEKFGAGATAKAFQSSGTGIDKARALKCLSMAVYYEAASESQAGQEAVAQVVLNRVAHPAYPSSICGVVFQGSERTTGCQFTFTCDGSLRREPSRSGWARAQSVALASLSGKVFAPAGLATHYHTHAVNPYWASSLDLIGSIGAHRFYRWKGSAGRAAAFTNSYAGREPLALPNTRTEATVPSQASIVAEPPPPPNAVIEISPASAPKVGGNAEAAPAGPPQSGDVKPEFRNSGRWLREPGAPKKPTQ